MSPRLLMKIFQPKICLQNFVSLGTWLKYGCFNDNFQLQYAFSFYAYKKEDCTATHFFESCDNNRAKNGTLVFKSIQSP